MKQKVSIARTLVHDPPVMIFDEPTVGLDVMAARTIVGFIRDCRNRGKTVIFSTHVMSEAEKLCDTIGIIHNGKLLAEGTLSELRARSGLDDLEEIFVRMVESSPRGVGPEGSA
jgi:sodium transport system ATP-binding protein